MKSEHNDLSPTELAKLTWYSPDSDKYRDLLHPTLKLAGEIGELLDLYAKHRFKPYFDWMECKNCKRKYDEWHVREYCICNVYTPKVLDELGDIWYYLRILAWIYDVDLRDDWYSSAENELTSKDFGLRLIPEMYIQVSKFMQNKDRSYIKDIYYNFLILLTKLDCTLDQLTKLNYHKLNSEKTNHGWEGAR